jgi:hypothetical protein
MHEMLVGRANVCAHVLAHAHILACAYTTEAAIQTEKKVAKS